LNARRLRDKREGVKSQGASKNLIFNEYRRFKKGLEGSISGKSGATIVGRKWDKGSGKGGIETRGALVNGTSE